MTLESQQPYSPDSAREHILAQLVSNEPTYEGALFEAAEEAGRPYRPTLFSRGYRVPTGSFEILGDSLLSRWLRVNDAVLPIPDPTGVFGSLASSDQETLKRLGTRVCVPLVHHGELAGWIAVNGTPRPENLARPQMIALSHGWAELLYTTKAAAAAQALSQSVSRSNRLNIAGQLAATIAHEVRNPLAAIRSMVQLVRDADAPPADHHRLLATVMEEVDRVNEVLTRMLSLGRPHQSAQELCSLIDVAQEAAGFCEAYATRQGQRIVRAGTDALWFVGDPFELRQVLVNVLLNACQASGMAAVISLDVSRLAEPDGSWATVRISDTGKGIAAADLSRVFDPFYTTKKDGAGLGLAICREIVQRHRGRMNIVSQLGSGTTVQIQLPLAESHATRPGR